jgi:hypothetical protein
MVGVVVSVVYSTYIVVYYYQEFFADMSQTCQDLSKTTRH